MRAADSDRQFVADRLRGALNEGRLDLSEYDDRLKRAYAARTYGELDTLLHDLPPVAPAERSRLATTDPVARGPALAPGAGRGRIPAWLLAVWGSWLSASLVCLVVWLATTPGGYPWPIWVAGPWGAVLLGRTIMAYASGDPEGYERAERERERRRRDRRGERHRGRGGGRSGTA
jgi:hypothetical protein